MNISPRLKADIYKVLVITIAYVLLSWFMTFHNDGYVNSAYVLGTTELYDLKLNFLLNTITGFLAGIMGGSILVYVNEKYFRNKSYGYALKATFIAYSIAFFLVTTVMSILTARINLGPGADFKDLFEAASVYFASELAFVYYIFWGMVSLFTLFFLQINDKFGPGMLRKFLAGKYHNPQEEQRIFMFMDMKASTSIAEKIGSKNYFSLLNDLFNDVTDAILYCEGEIYQYVGDEVVVSWSMDRGMRESNCLDCFRRIREKLLERAPVYEEKFGVVPEFKAGVHFGLVTAGEIGSIKKDIVYSGDVLNTASRIQEQCNQYNVDFLVSKETLELLGTSIPYEPVHLGNIELRGREQRIDLNTLKIA